MTKAPPRAPVVTAKASAGGSLTARVTQIAEQFSQEPSAFKRDLAPEPEQAAEIVQVEESTEAIVTRLADEAETKAKIDAASRDAKQGASTSPLSPSAAEQRAKALMQGYTGNSCMECGNFTMVRNGTCEKCDTCGSTSGCS